MKVRKCGRTENVYKQTPAGNCVCADWLRNQDRLSPIQAPMSLDETVNGPAFRVPNHIGKLELNTTPHSSREH